MRGKFKTAQGDVHYEVTGQGEPVVLVHGTPWSSFTWKDLIPDLEKNRTVYRYDLIGYGQSNMAEGQTVSLDVQTDIFCALLDMWGLQTPDIIAHDFGGAITLRAHLLAGREFNTLALMNVVAMAPWGSPFFAHVHKFEAAFAGVPDYIHAAILEAYIRGALYKDMPQADMEGLLNPWISTDGKPAFYRQIAQADQKYTDDVEPLYGDIRCPVQILWGEDDAWILIETGRSLHAAIPHSKFQAIPQAGHLVQLDNPGAVLKVLNDFLDR